MAVSGKLCSREAITEIVVNLPIELKVTGNLSADQDLSHLGLKSLDLVRLMLAVEEAFDLEIPPHLITPENFSSVGAIERLVVSLVN